MRISTTQITSSGVREMLLRQAELQYTQLQLSTQKRVLKPSDDPVAATSINFLRTEIAQIEQFNKNGDQAKASNELEESVLASMTNIVFRIKELSVSLGNGTYSGLELNAVKVEMEERLEELIGLGNTKNANGDFLFSGSLVKTKPFTQDSTGAISYNGDQNQRFLRISSGVVVPQSDSGFEAFVDIKNGNGKFVTGADAANTGDGIILPGSYTAPPDFLAEPYDITFATGGGGQLEYTATGRTSGTVFAGPLPYQDGNSINFNGVQTNITGTPQAGDSFSIDPSSSQDIFTSVQSMVNAVDNFVDTPAGRAQMLNILAAEQATLERNSQNIDVVRSRVGSRLAAVQSEESTNLSLLVTSRSALSDVEDLDVIEASTRLSQQLITLEAAQASFVRVQDLNLFNFLR